jgi:hypothetical protein
MPSIRPPFCAVLLLAVPFGYQAAQAPKTADSPVAVFVESSLLSATGQIRQFAFDGNPDTYFASAQNAGSGDHFTLILDRPVTAKSVVVTTGRPNGGDQLKAGSLEIAADGKNFEFLAPFAEGLAAAKPNRKIRAVRVKVNGDLNKPLIIREIVIDSDPAVTIFRNPVEFIVDVSEVPEMKEWAEKAARICERNYPIICEELQSEGFKPRTVITMTLKKNYKGVAAASGDRITGSASYFKSHPDDFGAMVHETVHCVQAYRSGKNPGWLVEGIADYIRFFRYEPGKLGKISPDRARYDGSYRVTAAFLNYIAEKYDKELVRKLNKAMREGDYNPGIWKALTKKSVQELGEEWRALLQPPTNEWSMQHPWLRGINILGKRDGRDRRHAG